jgi:hypothetical protein
MSISSFQAERRNRRILGKAVHPAALSRLHELFPDAIVKVRHEATPIELPVDTRRIGKHYYREPSHETFVYIDLDGDKRPGGTIFGTAICHHEDNFDRRKGIELAFRRALDIARRNYRQRRQDEAYRNQGRST